MGLLDAPAQPRLLAAAEALVAVTSTGAATYNRFLAVRFTIVSSDAVMARASCGQMSNDTAGSGSLLTLLDYTNATNLDANAKVLAQQPWISDTANRTAPAAISSPVMLLPPGLYLYVLGLTRITAGTAKLTTATGAPVRLEVVRV